MVGATTSMAVAAQTALPGESLYPVKRVIEQAETGLARGDAAKGKIMLANARGRLDEVRDLTERDTPASNSAVDATLEAFSNQADDASDTLLSAYAQTGDKALVTRLRSFTSSSMDRLAALKPVVPESSHESLVTAGERLAAIDRRASQACPTCEGNATSIPPSLLTASHPSTSVTTTIVAASRNPDLLEPAESAPVRTPAEPVSGQEIEDLRVPDLEVPVPTPTPTPTPTATPTPTKVDVKKPVNDVTKLLTGDLSTALDGAPVADQVLTDVGTTLDGTVDGVQGNLDSTTGSLLP